MRKLIALSLLVLSACSPQSETSKGDVTVTLPPGTGPWQIWTYNGEPIEYETVEYFGTDDVRVIRYPVYVSVTGQFIHKNGKPFTTVKNETVYWAQNGDFVSDRHNIIPRRIFSLHGEPLSNAEPLLLKEQLLEAKADMVNQL
jgi:hypothetical protein